YLRGYPCLPPLRRKPAPAGTGTGFSRRSLVKRDLVIQLFGCALDGHGFFLRQANSKAADSLAAKSDVGVDKHDDPAADGVIGVWAERHLDHLEIAVVQHHSFRLAFEACDQLLLCPVAFADCFSRDALDSNKSFTVAEVSALEVGAASEVFDSWLFCY